MANFFDQADPAQTAAPAGNFFDQADPAPMPAPIGADEFGAPIFADDAENAKVRDGMARAGEKALQGATFGMAPFGEAAVRSAVTGAPYADSLKAARDYSAETSKTNPGGAMIAEGLGTLPTAMAAGAIAAPVGAAVSAASRIGPWLASTAGGAGLGAASAAGHDIGSGDTANLGHDTAVGAGVGGGVGAASPLFGAMLQSVPNMVRGTAAGLRNMFSGAGRDAVAGQVLRETSGDFANGMARSPLPDLQLRTAQATGNPGIAALDRTLASEPGGTATTAGDIVQNGRTANQTTALAKALVGSDSGIEPTVLANQAAASGTDAITAADKALSETERKVWSDPALQGVKLNGPALASGVSDDVAAFPASWRDAVTGPQNKLGSFLGELKELGPESSIQDVNSVRSRLLGVARDARSGANPDSVTAAAASKMADSLLGRMGSDPGIAGAAGSNRFVITEPMQTTHVALPDPVTIRATGGAGAADDAGSAAVAANNPLIPQTARNIKPQSLQDWLISRGGVQDEGGEFVAGDLDKIHHRAGGRLVNPKGMEQDYAREAAIEEGFLKQGADINDFKDAVTSRQPVYRADDMAAAHVRSQQSTQGWQEDEARYNARDNVNVAAEQAGVRLSPAEIDHATDLHMQGAHPDDAIQQAAASTEARAFDSNAQNNAVGSPGAPLASGGGSPQAARAGFAITQPVAVSNQVPVPIHIRSVSSAEVPGNPDAWNAYQAARDFTRQYHTATGFNEFDNILHPNGSGNIQANPEQAFGRFFDMNGGTNAGMQRLQGVTDLLRQSGRGDEADNLQNAAQQYLKASILKQARAGNGVDATGSPSMNLATLTSTVNKVMPAISGTPMTAPIAGDVMAAGNAAELLNRPSALRGDTNSTTFEKLKNHDLVNAIIGQSGSSALGAAAGGYAAAEHGPGPWYVRVPAGMGAGAVMGRFAGPAISKSLPNALTRGPTEDVMRRLSAALADPSEYRRLLATQLANGPTLGAPGIVSQGVANTARAAIPTIAAGGR